MTLTTLVALLLVLAMAAACSPDPVPVPETCEELAPRIMKLSEERESPFSGRVLKFYDMEELEATGEYTLRCRAKAKRSRGGDAYLIFYTIEDEDGDSFIGMKAE